MNADYNYKIKYFNAVAVCLEENKTFSFKKYHNVKNEITRQTGFIEFIKNKFPHCVYINFYDKETKRFKERIYTS